jgi:hypothetical protein
MENWGFRPTDDEWELRLSLLTLGVERAGGTLGESLSHIVFQWNVDMRHTLGFSKGQFRGVPGGQWAVYGRV